MSIAIINTDQASSAASVATTKKATTSTSTDSRLSKSHANSSTKVPSSTHQIALAAAAASKSAVDTSKKLKDIFADFHALSKDGQRLSFQGFARLLLSYDPSSSNLPAIKFLLADQNNKGYLTLKDWTNYVSTINNPFALDQDSQSDLFSITNRLLDKFQIPKSLNDNGSSKIDIVKLNNALTNHYISFFNSENSPSNTFSPQVFAKKIERFLLNELISAKIMLFFEVNKDLLGKDESVPWDKMSRFANDLFSNKINSKFINHVLDYKNDTGKFSLSEIQNKIELLSKYLLINNVLKNKVAIDSQHLSNYDIGIISQYPQGESILISPPDSTIFIPVSQSWKLWKSRALSYIEPLYNFSLGAVSGAVGASLVYPIDTIKTSMQAQSSSSGASNSVVYKNSLDCLQKLLRQGGILRLYSGISAQLAGIAPEKAIKLTVNDLVRNYAKNRQSPANGSGTEIPLQWQMFAGCCAGAAQVAVTNPLEIVKIRLQMTQKVPTVSAASMGASAVKPAGAIQIVSELGFFGLYKGVAACLLRDIPFSCIYFPTYSFLKDSFLKYNKKNNASNENSLEFWQLLTAGGLAGCPAAFFTTPFDVIKTRLQMKQSTTNIAKVPTSSATVVSPVIYKGVKDAAFKIYQKEGPSAFFKGSIARVCRSSPQFGFTLACYEILQRNISFDSVFLKNDDENKSSTVLS